MSEPTPEPSSQQPQFSYISHLQLDVLLSAMKPITDHPEEHLFLTVHHALEIWFKQIIHDLRRTVASLEADDIPAATRLLDRLGEILRLAEGHWTVLETMAAVDFQGFRDRLTGASGMQSRQFREVEVACGLPEVAGAEYAARVEAAWPGLIASWPVTLRRAFLGVIQRSGLTLVRIHRERDRVPALFQLTESAFEVDRRFQSWRFSHILMVRRQIGMRTRGTGGTFGRDYLASTMDHLFFPELWELRHDLAAAAGHEVASP